MKLYKYGRDIYVEYQKAYYRLSNRDWDSFINDDNLGVKCLDAIEVRSSDQHAGRPC